FSLIALLLALPSATTLLPYTTLFRSPDPHPDAGALARPGRVQPRQQLQVPELPGRGSPAVDAERARDGHGRPCRARGRRRPAGLDRKSTRLNSSHVKISYAFFCLKIQ